MPLVMGMWLAALVAVFAFISVHGAGVYYYNPDELNAVDIAKGADLAEVFSFSRFEPHPLLGHILRHYWMRISDAPAFVRGLSLLFGVPVVFLYYRLGKMLNGALTGVFAAALAAFGYATVTQAYLARNYMMFLFFLSLAVYFYLLWKNGGGKAALASYAFFGFCACATHFSGIFPLAVIGACEMVRLFRQKTDWRACIRWVFLHALVVAGVAAVWLPLQKTGIEPYQTAIRNGSHSLADLLLYPQSVVSFLLPYWGDPDQSTPLLAGTAALLLLAAWHDKRFRPFFICAAGAVAFGTALFISNLYPLKMTGHLMWLFPFTGLALAWALADIWAWTAGRLLGPRASLYLAAVVVLLAGFFSYDAAARFADARDYPMADYSLTRQEWQDATDYLSALDGKSLIIARRVDAIELDPPGQNLFRFMSLNGPLSTLIPYYRTRMLVDLVRGRPVQYRGDLPIRMAEEAAARGLLEGVDQLVFVNSMRTMTVSRLMVDLMMCPLLDKTVLTFPTQAPERFLTPAGYMSADFLIMTVSKQVFFDQVVSPYGRARECLLSGGRRS